MSDPKKLSQDMVNQCYRDDSRRIGLNVIGDTVLFGTQAGISYAGGALAGLACESRKPGSSQVCSSIVSNIINKALDPVVDSISGSLHSATSKLVTPECAAYLNDPKRAPNPQPAPTNALPDSSSDSQSNRLPTRGPASVFSLGLNAVSDQQHTGFPHPRSVPVPAADQPITTVPQNGQLPPVQASRESSDDNRSPIGASNSQGENNLTYALVHELVGNDKVANDVMKYDDPAKLQAIENKLDKILKRQETQDKLELLKDISAATDMIAGIGNALDCRELAMGAKIVGGMAQIAASIALMATNPFTAIGGIFGAIFSLFGLFGKPGPDPTEVILENIRNLSEQLQRNHREVMGQFEQNAKMQKVLLDVMVKGFAKLYELINLQVGSMRVEMHAKFAEIQRLQIDILNQVEIGQQQLFLKDVARLENTVEDFVENRLNIQSQEHYAKGLASELSAWARTHSSNTLVNGRFLQGRGSLLQTPAALDRHFSEDPEETANFNLGCFNPDLPNPLLWVKVVTLYCDVTRKAWYADFDHNQQEKIEAKGKSIIEFSKQLREKPSLWESAFEEYNNVLRNLKEISSQIAKSESTRWFSALNESYTSGDVPHDAVEDGIDLLEETSLTGFISQFDYHSRPGKIKLVLKDNDLKVINVEDNNKIVLPKHVLGKLKDLSMKKLAEDLKLSSEMLCAQFMGSAEITFEQVEKVSGLDIKGSTKDANGYITLDEDLSENAVDEKWGVRFTVKIKFKNESESKQLTQALYEQKWSDVQRLLKDWDNKTKDIKVNDDKFGERCNQRLDRIVDSIGRGAAQPAYAEVVDLKGDAQNSLEMEIVLQRNRIAQFLIPDSGSSHALSAAFHQELVHLDLAARKLQHLMYIAGKDTKTPEGEALSTKILTKEKLLTMLNTQLTEFKRPDWLVALDDALDPKKALGVEDVLKLKNAKLENSHPTKIIEQGLLRLDVNKSIIEGIKHQFWRLREKLLGDNYKDDAFNQFLNSAIIEIIDAVKGLRDQIFQSSKYAIDKSDSMSPKKYGECFDKFKEWAIHTSTLASFVGDKNYAQQVFNKTNKYWESLIPLKLSANWATNIAVLYEWARLSNQDQGQVKNTALNYVMWHEGVSELRKMILNPELSQHSIGLILKDERSESSEHNQVKIFDKQNLHLKRISEEGGDFLKTLEYIAQSRAIEELIERYNAKFNELLQHDQNESTLEIIASELEGYRLWIKSYSQMILGHFQWEPVFEQLLSKEKLLAQFNALKSTGGDWKNWLNEYKVTLNKSTSDIADLFGQIKESIKFRDALIAFSQDTKSINTVFSIEGANLVINTKDFDFALDTQKIELLEAFLGQAQGIKGLCFRGDDFSNPKTLKILLKFIARHPQLHYLGLSDCQLSSEILEECLAEFSALGHIHSLDLSHNSLVTPKKDVAVLTGAQTSKIIDVMVGIGGVKNVCLDNCGLDERSVLRIEKDLQQLEKRSGVQCVLGKFVSSPENSVSISNKADFTHVVKLGPPIFMQDLLAIRELKSSLEQQKQQYQMALNPTGSQSSAQLMSSPIGSFRANALSPAAQEGTEEKSSVEKTSAEVKF